MAAPQFVHLRLHSEYSITDGVVRIDDAITTASEDSMGALALTDLGNLFGLIKFYSAARSGGIKPITGADIWLSNEQEPDQPHRMLLLVQNHSGYLNPDPCRSLKMALRVGESQWKTIHHCHLQRSSRSSPVSIL